jgi:glycosyltransferase involved in cell wall biosynthesis
MRILHLVPGSGGTFYCQNCVRDRALVRALRSAGHDVIMVPLYLPMFGEEGSVGAKAPIFFGGVNMYLREKVPFLRNMPLWLDRLLDSHWVLRQAAAREQSTNAADLGPMTLSMLRGRRGNQQKEFDRFLAWLAEQDKPDIIHVSNALLLGFAPEIAKVVDARIVCSLQDEEPWVDAMHPPYDRQVWETISENAKCVSRFISTSAWYAERMIVRMGLAPDRVSVVYPGVETDTADAAPLDFNPPVIGFLERLSRGQGLGLLMDAFIALKRMPQFQNLRLRATGGCTPADQRFRGEIQAKLRSEGMDGAVEFIEDFQLAQRGEFLRSLSVLSVPVPGGEAFGLQLLEAMAQGVPVVQPAEGSYPEIVHATGGGVLYDPKTPGGLTQALQSLLEHPDEARRLGHQGRAAILEKFNMDRVVRDMTAVYAAALDKQP